MSFYECVFIVRHDMSPNEVNKLTDQFASIITEGKGTVVKNEYWGLRGLAYPINKTNKGHYIMLGLDTAHAPLAEMERQMRISEDVVRYITVKVETMDNKPSVVLRYKNGDDAEAA